MIELNFPFQLLLILLPGNDLKLSIQPTQEHKNHPQSSHGQPIRALYPQHPVTSAVPLKPQSPSADTPPEAQQAPTLRP